MTENNGVSKTREYQITLDQLAKLLALLVNKNRGVLFIIVPKFHLGML